ncbi:hypothetical protein AYR56_10080 [Loigolactobacillus backii]|uniref:Uncharacterized protein n=1 Tax=Loigolactobacillus backii TaxID=375175 RepID=A0A192H2D0_9LACO|nr:hypothetical protein [Loigolactobacillus backii]ANK62520.1 hypothetical protein AYR53_06920 [Loigolactobacillus backii]ANK70470.1 hypothetical protein AYR56_10080 [Loigolactobacillus backii]
MLKGTEIDGDTVIIGDVDDIEYILHVFCGDPLIIRPKYTINLRFKKSNIQLIRVDIGGRHRNPNEKSARNYPHIHIYNPNYSKKDRIAYLLDSKKFPNIDNILRTFEDVLRYTNIQRKLNEYWRPEDNDI